MHLAALSLETELQLLLISATLKILHRKSQLQALISARTWSKDRTSTWSTMRKLELACKAPRSERLPSLTLLRRARMNLELLQPLG